MADFSSTDKVGPLIEGVADAMERILSTTTNETGDPHSEAGAEADNLLRKAVISRLGTSGYPALGDLKCEVLGGGVVVSGAVPSFFLKQMAQTVILQLGNVKGVKNQLEVGKGPGHENPS